MKWVTVWFFARVPCYRKSTATLMQGLFLMWTQTNSQVRPIKKDNFYFLANDHIRKSPSTESGVHLEDDAGETVFACNKRNRSCRTIHQLMPEHFKTTTHNLQGRLQKRNRNTSVLRQSWQYSVCSTKCQRTRAAMQRTSQLHCGGWTSKCALSYFHSNSSQILSS